MELVGSNRTYQNLLQSDIEKLQTGWAIYQEAVLSTSIISCGHCTFSKSARVSELYFATAIREHNLEDLGPALYLCLLPPTSALEKAAEFPQRR